MFDIGFPELLLIAGVTLVVLGPEELPRVMLKVGRFVGTVKRQLGSWQDELERVAEAEPQKKQTAQPMLPLETKPAEPELPLDVKPADSPEDKAAHE